MDLPIFLHVENSNDFFKKLQKIGEDAHEQMKEYARQNNLDENVKLPIGFEGLELDLDEPKEVCECFTPTKEDLNEVLTKFAYKGRDKTDTDRMEDVWANISSEDEDTIELTTSKDTKIMDTPPRLATPSPGPSTSRKHSTTAERKDTPPEAVLIPEEPSPVLNYTSHTPTPPQKPDKTPRPPEKTDKTPTLPSSIVLSDDEEPIPESPSIIQTDFVSALDMHKKDANKHPVSKEKNIPVFLNSNPARRLGMFPFRPPFESSKQDQLQVNSITEEAVEEMSLVKELEAKCKNVSAELIETILNEMMDDGKTVTWDDISGLEYAKSIIQETVVLPQLRPDLFKGLRRPPKGILLFGPPGTGKTMIGKCIASQSNSKFFSISASSLTSKWIGEGEKLVRALFAVAAAVQPSVIFVDEIDSMLSKRSDNEHESSRRMKVRGLLIDKIEYFFEDSLFVY